MRIENSGSYVRAIERAARAERLPASLRGALRAYLGLLRRSGRDPGRRALERELADVLPAAFHGDARACDRAYLVTSWILGGRDVEREGEVV